MTFIIKQPTEAFAIGRCKFALELDDSRAIQGPQANMEFNRKFALHWLVLLVSQFVLKNLEIPSFII